MATAKIHEKCYKSYWTLWTLETIIWWTNKTQNPMSENKSEYKFKWKLWFILSVYCVSAEKITFSLFLSFPATVFSAFPFSFSLLIQAICLAYEIIRMAISSFPCTNSGIQNEWKTTHFYFERKRKPSMLRISIPIHRPNYKNPHSNEIKTV